MLYPFQTIAEMIVPILAGEIPAEEEDAPEADAADAEEADTADDTEDSESEESDGDPEVEADTEEPEEEEQAAPTDERDTASWAAEVKRLRAENKKRRLSERDKDSKLKDFEAEKLKAERSKLAEVDRLKAEKADLEAKTVEQDAMLQSAVKVNVVESVAAGLGFRDTTDAVTMLGGELDQIVIDPTGNIDREEVEELLAELLTEKPYLKKVTETEQKVKKVRKAPTNTPSDTKVPTKIPSTKTDDDDKLSQQITDLNNAGQGSKAFQLMLAKRFAPAREKLRKTLFRSDQV